MGESTDIERCGVGIRGMAMVADSFVWFVLFLVTTMAVGAATGQLETTANGVQADLEGPPAMAAFALFSALGVGYHALLEWKYGKTAGKYLVGIEATAADGSPLTLRESLVRNVLRLVDFLPMFYVVGIVAVVLSEENQRVGDRVADTAVVRR